MFLYYGPTCLNSPPHQLDHRLIGTMRIPSIGSVLALICSGAIIFHASAIPDLDMLKVKRDTTATDATDVSLRKIDWKLVKGGLSKVNKPLLTAATCTSAIFTVLSYYQRDNRANSCEPLWGSQGSDDGSQEINFYYYVTTTGKNCDSTAQLKTISLAIDDAWDDVHNKKYNYACIDLSHGGTWHGHLAVATTASGKDVNTMCS